MDTLMAGRTILHIIFLWVSFSTGSSCTDKQIENCQKYAQEDKLNQLEGGGVCTPQTYVHYTHRCTVTDYRQSIDFCCCAIDTKVMCCRYNQNWDFFRCSEPEDTIASLTARPIPLKILLPSILGPVAVILCCIFCCIKCYNHWASEKKGRRKEDTYYPHPPAPIHSTASYAAYGLRTAEPEAEPLNAQNTQENWKRPLGDSSPESDRPTPSAPPIEGDIFPGGSGLYRPVPSENHVPELRGGHNNALPSNNVPEYTREDSMHSNISGGLHVVGGPGGGGHYACQFSQNGIPGRCPSCNASACAPPAYEESLQHPIMPH